MSPEFIAAVWAVGTAVLTGLFLGIASRLTR